MLGIIVAKERYERWWLGKYCRLAGQSHRPFKKVVKIETCGPPSFVSGQITFIYADESEEIVSGGLDAYKPRKFDVEVATTNKEKEDEANG